MCLHTHAPAASDATAAGCSTDTDTCIQAKAAVNVILPMLFHKVSDDGVELSAWEDIKFCN